MFTVTFENDVHAYYEQAHHLWEGAETRNNLILGLSLRLMSDLHAYGDAFPLMALVKDEKGEIGASALMTPPFRADRPERAAEQTCSGSACRCPDRQWLAFARCEWHS